MKKIVVLIFLFLFLGFSVFAESIGDVSVSFCNNTTGADGKYMNFVAKAGVPYEFCLEIANTSKEKVSLSLGFVDGEITNDEIGNKACSHQGSLFGPYVDFLEKTMLLSSGSVVQKTGTLSFPLGYSGQVNGCLVYNILDQKKMIQQDGSSFDVIVRKANFMDGYVVGEFKRNIEFDKSLVSHYIDKKDDALVVLLPFDNSGVLPEFLQYTGRLSNILGYERFVTSSKIIEYGTSSLIEFRFADIPFYKGVYNLFFQGSSVLDTRLDLSYVPEKYKQKIDFSYDKNIILVPWVLIFGVLGFFVALFVLRWLLKIVLRR
ncbi:MAG: hypothetical protein PHR61_03435 [Candidatus Absconditabacteria bacterium]|nr:hypothetical protein [Candidatus Absconditabacteria bacterium]